MRNSIIFKNIGKLFVNLEEFRVLEFSFKTTKFQNLIKRWQKIVQNRQVLKSYLKENAHSSIHSQKEIFNSFRNEFEFVAFK